MQKLNIHVLRYSKYVRCDILTESFGDSLSGVVTFYVLRVFHIIIIYYQLKILLYTRQVVSDMV